MEASKLKFVTKHNSLSPQKLNLQKISTLISDSRKNLVIDISRILKLG